MPHYHVVAAIIQHRGKILCAQKGAGKYSYIDYKYEFPGGKVETGEPLEAALRREVLEEIHLNIHVDELYHTVFHKYPDFSITMAAYLCTTSDVGSLLLEEHIQCQWLSPAELPQLNWAAADLPIAEKLAAAAKNV
ncbi:(deoxy)nucleoside triphosphate pyrophosphohydrolase [Parapedobacter deserti]|uniref:8-oxo-dGTP diphosphatase n=1 Tax=Parapedobacter deserti TaxID=1912957 RepID=A0ABV7JTD8_9SPHI